MPKVTIVEDPKKSQNKVHPSDLAHLTPGNLGNKARKISSVSGYKEGRE